jgi:hypothetical protein
MIVTLTYTQKELEELVRALSSSLIPAIDCTRHVAKINKAVREAAAEVSRAAAEENKEKDNGKA